MNRHLPASVSNELRWLVRDHRTALVAGAALPFAFFIARLPAPSNNWMQATFFILPKLAALATHAFAALIAFRLFRLIDPANANSPWRLWPVSAPVWAGTRLALLLAVAVLWPTLLHRLADLPDTGLMLRVQWFFVWSGVFLA